MNIEEFIFWRYKEKEWLNINGYENCDPNTNGEFNTIERFINKGDTFIDVGANIGLFSNEAKKNTYGDINIIAFEANETLIDYLKDTLGENAKVFQVALGDNNKKVKFGVNQLDSGTSSIFERKEMMPSFNEAISFVEVEMKQLDDYYDIINFTDEQNSIFLKIDVEGAELPVMRGAKKLLASNRKIILTFEYSFAWKEAGESLKEAFHFLEKNAFDIYRITPLGLENMRFFAIEMENYLNCNYCAVKNVDINKFFETSFTVPTKQSTAEMYMF